MEPDTKPLQIPVSLVDVVDVKQARREIKALEEFMAQSAIREAGKQPKLPRTSRTLEELARMNGLNLLIAEQRQIVASFLNQLISQAPVVHMSFATDPSAAFLAKIVTWFRQEVHPYTLIQVGLQPSIAAGCIVRTPNRYIDLSLRKHFTEKRQVLMASLDKLVR